jgi:phosphatidyl-myo-inositol dimannoside synthase
VPAFGDQRAHSRAPAEARNEPIVRHILLTNDFPPKVGGIQSYLWELWRRLSPDDVTVFTASYPRAEWWDRQQKFPIVRAREPVLLPQPHLARRVRELARSTGAEAVVIDPALPLGLIGPSLGLPYAVVLHGAEVTVPGRLPVSRQLLVRALSNASLWIAAGTYPEAEARRAMGQDGSQAGASGVPPAIQVPPGVDTERFHPLAHIDQAAARAHLGLPVKGPLVASVSRLVPRKGMDTLIEAASMISDRFAGLSVAIAGAGRDRRRLEKVAAGASVRVKFVGKLTDTDLPAFYACADVFALCCRARWWGLEQEGFGIVLVEAAASGVPCITIDSGGAGEAVVNGETGLVVSGTAHAASGTAQEASGAAQAASGAAPEASPGLGASQGPARVPRGLQARVADALASVLSDPVMARRMGEAGRRRAEEELSYDTLALRLASALDQLPTMARRPRARAKKATGTSLTGPAPER